MPDHMLHVPPAVVVARKPWYIYCEKFDNALTAVPTALHTVQVLIGIQITDHMHRYKK